MILFCICNMMLSMKRKLINAPENHITEHLLLKIQISRGEGFGARVV